MGRLAIGESVQVSDYLAEYETLQTFFRVADERGHRAPSAVVDEHGTVVSHPDYVDRMGAAHQRAGAWAFCRAQAAEAFGLTSGTDWIRSHNLHLMFQEGSPYLNEPHLYSQLYIQRFGSPETQMLTPVCEAGPVAWSDDGSRICVLEERLGHSTDGTKMAGFLLWEYELSIGSRRLVMGFPVTDRLGITDLTYSADAAWIHICDWNAGRNLLVRASDGLVIELPVRSAAVAFNPRRDAGDMTVITLDQSTGDAIVHDYDLANDELTQRSRLITPTGLPMRVRELDISPRGEAVLTAPVGVTGLEQLERGGIHIAAYLDIDSGQIEPVLSVSFRTPGAQRRHTSPRWCDDRAIVETTPLVIADRLMQQGAVRRCAPDNKRVINDQAERFLETMNGIEAAWRSTAIPSHRFAQEFVQYAISLREINPDRVEPSLANMRQRTYRDPVTREVLQRIRSGRRGWVSLASTGIPTPDQSMPAPPGPTVVEGVAHALLDLIAAHRRPEATVAIRLLLITAQRAGRLPSQVWLWLDELTSAALAHGQFLFVAQAALAANLWHIFFLPNDPTLGNLGLPSATKEQMLPLMVNGFEAATHLSQRHTIADDGDSTFDAESVRDMCQQMLTSQPIAEFLSGTARPTTRTGPAPVALDPRVIPLARTNHQRTGTKRVFISYVREDSADVDRLAAALRNAGADVWVDRTHLLPGQRWASVIRKEVADGDFFIACFSPAYFARTTTFMNEEINIAVEQLRLRRPDMIWFLPVLLQPIAVPDFTIGGGQTLDQLHCVDVAALGWDEAIRRLMTVIRPPA